MKCLVLAIAALLVVPACAGAQAAPPAASATRADDDEALAARVRASLAGQFGEKRAARVSIVARDGVVRVEAPELSLGDRAKVEQTVRAVPGVTRLIAVVGTVLPPPPVRAAGIVGEKGRLPAAGAAIVGEKGRLPAAGTAIVGEKGRVTRARAGIIGEKGPRARAGTAVVGEKGRQPATGTAIVGEKGRKPSAGTGIIGEKGPRPLARPAVGDAVRIDDAALADAARRQLARRLGSREAARLRIHAHAGVVLVEPIGDKAPAARGVADALSGLAGMQRLDNRLQP